VSGELQEGERKIEDEEAGHDGQVEALTEVLIVREVDLLHHLDHRQNCEGERNPVRQDRLVEHEVDGCEDVLTVDVQPDPAGQARQVDDAVAGSAGVDGDL